MANRPFDVLASLRVGISSMVVIAVSCAVATFYESAHGTSEAQRVFYRSWWFNLTLAVFGTSILFSMLKRFPWRRHQAGFVFAHVGILLLLVGSVVSLWGGMDGSVALWEGDSATTAALPQSAIAVRIDGREVLAVPARLEDDGPRPDRPWRLELPGASALLVEEHAAHVEVHETSVEGEAGPPAVHYVLSGGFGEEHGWLVADGREARADFGPLALTLTEAEMEAEAEKALRISGRNEIAFVGGPGSRLRYALASSKQPTTAGEVTLGRAVSAPWMGMTVTVEKALVHATRERTVRPAAPPAKASRRQPAVRVRLEKGGLAGPPVWVPYSEVVEVRKDAARAEVTLRDAEAPLGFGITLIDFRSQKYPGSSMAATYESRVRIDDPVRGVSEHRVSMNHPLHYAGYTFFQASYMEGEPMGSVLSVSRSPGLPLVYAGTALLTLGVAWMFYVKPWLVRREARRVKQERERSRVPTTLAPSPVAGR